MAIFSWKKGSGSENKGGGESGAGGATTASEFTPQPEKARTWFDHARKAADSTNYEGALAYYANGIKLDPETMSAHEAMLDAAIKYANKGGQPASGKEIKQIEDAHVVSRFAAAEFAWFKDVTNLSLAMKALEAAIKAGQREWGRWIAPQVLRVAQTQKKVSKGQMVQLKELFKQVEAWEEAIKALAKAKELDPTDNSLDHEYKD